MADQKVIQSEPRIGEPYVIGSVVRSRKCGCTVDGRGTLPEPLMVVPCDEHQHSNGKNETPQQKRIRNESNEIQADIAIKLERITALLATNSKQTQTWGHVASLEKVSSDLDELIDFLK